MRFDPNALAASTADVSIDTGSVATADKERDGILKGAGWFEVEQYPHAKFTAKEFAKTKDGFEAHGELTLRTISVPVTFRFTETRKRRPGRTARRSRSRPFRLQSRIGRLGRYQVDR